MKVYVNSTKSMSPTVNSQEYDKVRHEKLSRIIVSNLLKELGRSNIKPSDEFNNDGYDFDLYNVIVKSFSNQLNNVGIVYHHIDEKTSNNELENVLLCTSGSHASIHSARSLEIACRYYGKANFLEFGSLSSHRAEIALMTKFLNEFFEDFTAESLKESILPYVNMIHDSYYEIIDNDKLMKKISSICSSWHVSNVLTFTEYRSKIDSLIPDLPPSLDHLTSQDIDHFVDLVSDIGITESEDAELIDKIVDYLSHRFRN